MDLAAYLVPEDAAYITGKVIEVGLSGGLDSVVLLHLLSGLKNRYGFSLCAVHVHHGLSPNADVWAAFCHRYCSSLAVPLRTVKVCVDKGRAGIEGAARAERYRVFSDGLSDIMALAHHQDDQIETFMLAAARGGGLRSLASMPVWRDLDEATKIWRPLLPFTRQELYQYAAAHDLDYIEDESNSNPAFLRNRLRHELLPLCRKNIPGFDRHILANIESLQEDLALLDELVCEDYEAVCASGRFSVGCWRKFGSRRRRHLLRLFAVRNGLGLPGKKSLADFERVLAEAGKGEWRLPDGMVFAYRNRLFPFPARQFDRMFLNDREMIKGRLKDILADNGFILQRAAYGLPEDILFQDGTIRSVNSSDVIKLACGTKRVKKVLQEYHILPSIRKKWPLIINSEGRCIAVANLMPDLDFQVKDGVIPVFCGYQEYITELNYK